MTKTKSKLASTKSSKYREAAVALQKPLKNNKKDLIVKALEAKLKKLTKEKKLVKKKSVKSSSKKKAKKEESEEEEEEHSSSESESESESDQEEEEESGSDDNPSDSESEGEEEKESVAVALKIHAEIKKKAKGGDDKKRRPPYAAAKKMVRYYERHYENQYLAHDQVRPQLPLPYETVKGLVKLAASELGLGEHVRFTRAFIETVAHNAYNIHGEYLFPEVRAQWESQQSSTVLATPEATQQALVTSPIHPAALIKAAERYWSEHSFPGQPSAMERFWAVKKQCDEDPAYIQKQEEEQQRVKRYKQYTEAVVRIKELEKKEREKRITADERIELTKCYQDTQTYRKEQANAEVRKKNKVIANAEKELKELDAREERIKARIEVLDSEAVGGLTQSKHQVDETRKVYLKYKDLVVGITKEIDELRQKRSKGGLDKEESDRLNDFSIQREQNRHQRDEAEKIFHHAERAFKSRVREREESEKRLTKTLPEKRIEIHTRLAEAKEEVAKHKADVGHARQSLALAKRELPNEEEDDAMDESDE